MRHRSLIATAIACVLMWAASEVFAGRGGGRGGGGRGGGGGMRGGGGGMRGGGGMSRGGGFAGGGGMSRPSGGRTPSFSQPSMNRPSTRPSAGISRPSQLPSSRPVGGAGARPGLGNGTGRPSQLPAAGTRPGTGTRPPVASNRPSTRPDSGRRPSTLPSFGAGVAAGAAGAGIANRLGDRATTLPGLGDRRPSADQLPAGDRRNQLHDRLAGNGGIGDRERPSQLPERDWSERRQDWQDRRDEIRNDWQDHRDDMRDDWHDWRDDHYPWYGGWYWGFAPGYWGWWDPMWDDYPVAATAGLTWWGANAMSYSYGCGGEYFNPYYSETSVVNYSEPMTVPADAEPATPAPEDLDKFDQARVAFQAGKYNEALKLVDEAAVKMPHDAVLHEFRSLVLFALKRYRESAAAIHAVLAVGPGWDWKTLSSLYSDVETYTTQLRALEAYRGDNPTSADAALLLGYHYLSTGSAEAALGQFRRASELQPKDTVSASLVRSLSPRDAQSKPAPSDRVGATEPKAVPADDLIGSWAATGKGTAKYSMTLDNEGTFTWAYSRGTRRQQVKGVYTVEGNVLAMEPNSGGVMLAELTIKTPGSLHFQMIGGDKDDPGLDFEKGKE